jgi:hypothetical protein
LLSRETRGKGRGRWCLGLLGKMRPMCELFPYEVPFTSMNFFFGSFFCFRTKGLTGEENLVLSHIKSSGNEGKNPLYIKRSSPGSLTLGIWTKHLKSKTSLHQTIIDRCLKTLTQKRLIKRVQSVQHITRKIYMLEGLEPSSTLTGGPWYTDNELDAEFIRGLGEGCWRIVWDVVSFAVSIP